MNYKNSKGNALLFQKALFAKQLVHYANLCKIYQTLADDLIERENIHPTVDLTVNQQIERILGPYLDQAAHGDLSFIDNNPNGRVFDKNQREAFNQYKNHSQLLHRYRMAADKLNYATMVATKDNKLKFDVSPEAIEDFEKFMRSDKDTASVLDNIKESPKSWIGHTSFLRTRKALSVIAEVDPDYIKGLNISPSTLTPKSFAAEISGARGHVYSQSKNVVKDLNQISNVTFKKERMKYVQRDKDGNVLKDENGKVMLKQISGFERFHKGAYTIGHYASEATKNIIYGTANLAAKAGKFAGEKLTAGAGALAKAVQKHWKKVAAFGLAAVMAGVINFTGNVIQFQQLSDLTNPEAGYTQTVTKDTQQVIADVDQMIADLESSSTLPSSSQLFDLREAMDEEINVVLSDVISRNVREQYPNLDPTSISTYYNGEEGYNNFIYITCQDQNGVEKTFAITNSSSQGANVIDTSFHYEYQLDHEDGSTIRSATGTGTAYQQADNITNYLETMKKRQAIIHQMAGSDYEINSAEMRYVNALSGGDNNIFLLLAAKHENFWDLAYIKSTIPEKETTVEVEEAPVTAATDHVAPVVDDDYEK